jgi:beta-phosphoglucomutase-like phosphatase (HAD superfamily)
MFPTPKIVLMDLCGTLLDSINHDREVMDEIGMTYAGKTYAELRHLKEPSRSMRYNFKNFFGDKAEEAHELYIDQLIDRIPKTNLFPNSRQFLSNAKSVGVEIALISNRPASYIEAVLDVHQIRTFIVKGFSAVNDFTVEKPDGRVVDQALTLLGRAKLNRREVVFIVPRQDKLDK